MAHAQCCLCAPARLSRPERPHLSRTSAPHPSAPERPSPPRPTASRPHPTAPPTRRPHPALSRRPSRHPFATSRRPSRPRLRAHLTHTLLSWPASLHPGKRCVDGKDGLEGDDTHLIPSCPSVLVSIAFHAPTTPSTFPLIFLPPLRIHVHGSTTQRPSPVCVDAIEFCDEFNFVLAFSVPPSARAAAAVDQRPWRVIRHVSQPGHLNPHSVAISGGLHTSPRGAAAAPPTLHSSSVDV
ncbi:hypothetical protein C8F04DRAFT_1253053 [Mycena alexandri]|uniref:Uncharacterized protein n=1 Tax=Mycena alexandri TaxID=1745969 RepID=A0AAD6TA95_9AGAR|nr:hypothetical protein C8F04DRAFT_1253053 [Mycena alexandri]